MYRGICTSALAQALSKEKRTRLQAISSQFGVIQAGTKAELIQRLTDQVCHFTPVSQFSSVLSFDLGYRNLAYCHLDKHGKILDWRLVDLELSSFHPSAVAPIVRELVRTSLLPQLKHTQAIAVEQQRARSGGGVSVLEGTLRVNCVEAVLWTALYEAADHLQESLIMRPVRRQAVDKVFEKELDDIISTNPSTFAKIKNATYKKKQATSIMVHNWLESGTVVQCQAQYKAMFDQEKKKDDLSDCLTQALAWYKWQGFTQSFIDYFKMNNEIIKTV
ncbi:ribonuclease H-like protein [Backusella circina FSU 941]|nr:ribonuclease H-like protein [Backusella circina FSU 941]